ncbi:hypothetical protein [Pseudomonas lopnurensis]|uniref:hypothetical protein n=1 Tax=Pseudomonas lopnurensis TaxID=1477517 RepID=UPI00187A44B1|nr:hypothetical protein [Pseudomonas lopnurensis]MBE7373033.1 hypothetical protein [Pseudomonas lopnurensis]
MAIHLLKIDFRALKMPLPEPVAQAGAWSIFARCDEPDEAACEVFRQILAMPDKRDQKASLAALRKLIQVAASGHPLTSFYDKKQCHEAHRFNYQGKERTIWRIWQGDIRLAFYYGEGKIIFLTQAFAKREDKLSKQQKTALETEAKCFIDAEAAGTLAPFTASAT